MGVAIGGLTEVPRTKRPYDSNQSWGFSKGDVREAFQRVFSPDKEYVLFQTIANQAAVEVLQQYVGFRKDMGFPWSVRKIRKGEEPVYVPGASDQNNGLDFDNSLMDSYQRAIDRIAKRIVGQHNFAHYPLVSSDAGHIDGDPKAIFWPRVYIVNAEKEETLKDIIDNLSGDESLEVLRKLESPQFYQMAEIETLHRHGIKPIVRLERELRAGAQNLSMYIDFLAQMTETYRWTGPVIDFD